MFDNAKSILFVAVIAGGAFLWGFSYGLSPKVVCPECPKCTTSSKKAPKRQPKYEWVSPFEYFNF